MILWKNRIGTVNLESFASFVLALSPAYHRHSQAQRDKKSCKQLWESRGDILTDTDRHYTGLTLFKYNTIMGSNLYQKIISCVFDRNISYSIVV